MNDISMAKHILKDGGHTCVLCRGDKVYTSDAPGISPMLDFLAGGTELAGFSAADKIVGRAAAFLFILADVRAVHAEVMTHGAAELLSDQGIAATADLFCDCIINRKGDGPCPMESAVQGISDPAEAERAIRTARAKLTGGAPAGGTDGNGN